MFVHDYPSNKHGRKWFMFYASESQNENFTIEGWAKKKWWVVFNDAQSKARIWVHLDSKKQFLPSDTRMWQEKKSWVLGIDLLRTWILDKQEASIACEFDKFCLILCFQLYKSIIEHHWTTNTPSIPCHFCLGGTSFAQILSSLEYWQLTNDQLGGSSVGLRCSLAWLKTRQAFDKAVALFNYLELWRCEAGKGGKRWDFGIFGVLSPLQKYLVEFFALYF